MKTPTQQISGVQRNATKYQQRHGSEIQEFKRGNRSAETPAGWEKDADRKSPFSSPMRPIKSSK